MYLCVVLSAILYGDLSQISLMDYTINVSILEMVAGSSTYSAFDIQI